MKKLILATLLATLLTLSLASTTLYTPKRTPPKKMQKPIYDSYDDDEYSNYNCPAYSTYDPSINSCTCWNHYVPDGYGNCVFGCPEGFQLDSSDLSRCIRMCPWNNWWDAQEDQCVPCPLNSLYDPAYGYCRCLGGFQMSNGRCIKQAVKAPVKRKPKKVSYNY